MSTTPRNLSRHVLMTSDTVGGVWTFSLELASALAHKGVQVDLATMGTPLSGAQWNEVEEVSGLRVFESDFKLEWMSEPWEDVHLAGNWLQKLEQNRRPDVVHLNGYVHASLPWRAPTLVVAHSCVWSWWQAVKGGMPPGSWNEYHRRVREGLLSADMVIAPSAAMLRSLEANYGPLRAKGVIPNCRSAGLFAPADKQEYVFSAGRIWDEAKNINSLDRISGEVLWPVFVAGDKGDYASSEFSSLNLLGKLAQEEMGSWYGHAAIFAHPARYEPFGLCVLEAGLAGCALVLGDIPSLRENWGQAALFVPPGDPGALRDAINRLILDAPLRNRMAIKARTRALLYKPERMVAQYLAAYGELLTRKARQAAS